MYFFLPNLDSFQFAYRPKYSTLDAVASLVHFIASSLDKKNKFVRLCFLDFSNAFNNLDRSALCSLLHLKGVPSSILSWLSDYFLVVHSVLAPMLIFNVVWILLSIGPLNELCPLTHSKVLMFVFHSLLWTNISF